MTILDDIRRRATALDDLLADLGADLVAFKAKHPKHPMLGDAFALRHQMVLHINDLRDLIRYQVDPDRTPEGREG